MKIAISADSTCDLPQELVEKYNIHLNAMPFSLGEDDLRHDGVTGTSDDVFEYVEKTGKLPTTSAYNEFEYTEHFNKILENYDAVIHISFSWEISSTGLNARRAAEAMQNVYTIDSTQVSCGFSLLVIEAAELAAQGLEPQEIVARIEELKTKVQTSFLIDTLKYMHKGGRCSGVTSLSASIFSIKPRISLVNGKMEVTKKYMGNINTCALKYTDEILREVEPNTKRAFVVYSSPLDCTEKIVKKLKDRGFEEVVTARCGPSISIHCGKGTIGVIYLAK